MLWLDIVTLNKDTDFKLSHDNVYWIFNNTNASFYFEDRPNMKYIVLICCHLDNDLNEPFCLL